MSMNDQRGGMQDEPLFKAFAEQLKAPLIQIANEAELEQASADSTALAQIRLTASQTLDFIDAYLLSRQQQALELEPVSISSIMYDAAELLRPLASQHGCQINIRVDGRYGPVMAHREGLQTMLVTLGHSLLQADSSVRPQLTMSVYKTSAGIAAGVFGGSGEWQAASLRKALSTANPQAGLQIARDIVGLMSSQLQVAHHRKLTGLAAYFQPSAQLKLV